MDQNRRGGGGSRPYQFHPARPLIHDLFNLYLGKNSRQKLDESIREPPNKAQKRVSALNRELPPQNEQFILDFEQLQSQFPDQEQLRAVTESVLTSMVIQCSSHAPRAEFLRFALRSLSSIGFIQWDTFFPCLLSSVSSAETSIGQSSTSPTVSSTSLSQSGNALIPHSTSIIPNSSNFQSASPASPLPSIIGSPSISGGTDGLSSVNLKLFDGGQQSTVRAKKSVVRNNGGAISSLRQLCCKIILSGLEFNLKPVTYVDIFNHMMNWLVNWGDQRRVDGSGGAERGEWLHICLDVIWVLVDDDKCRVPFYELLRGGLQFIDNIPDDEALFTLILEIHRRRDMMALNMQMLDQHLHCPTFGTQRLLSQATTNVSSGEAVVNMRYSPITYPSVLGEPLHGEELASCIERGSLDWERAVRCVKHALRVTPSSDWWKRVLLVAPCYRNAGPFAGAVFSCEMICEATIDRIIELLKLTNLGEVNCWQDWLVFSDMFYFLMKNGCIDFVDFVDKLVIRFAEGDQNILRTNHVTLLFAQIIRVELVMTALNTDPRKVETTRKMLSFHKEDRNSDPNNPQTILLDFISSCQNLRIWSLNTTTREYLNNEQLQKGKQIDEWWRQVSKGERMMDYMNLDDRSIGMFWVVSYTMAQPACETVMNWLTSAGVTELLPVGSNPQMNERMMVMREVSPLPASLLSGFSINLFTKLAYQMEDSMFFGQVVPNVAMVETYVRLLILSPHSLFRPLLTHLSQKSPTILSKPAITLLVLEILNYRLLPLYRYQGKSKHLMYDITKIVSMFKGKRGEHRIFRLSENLCMNLIFSLREFFIVKKEGKGPTEFTETLNRITVMTLAIIIRTRGIAEAEQMLYLPSMLEQILATSQHTWSEKTLRYFPSLLRDALSGQTDRRGLAIQTWQQVETPVINQCTQLLSPSADPGYLMTYIGHSFLQHRQYLCAGAWTLMHGHPENINTINLGRVLREFSPEEVTANIYTMVDVLLHHIHLELQQGHPLQELILKASANLAYFIWTGELLPLDILLLALIDRDDDPHALRIAVNLLERQELQQRVKFYILNHAPPEHWLFSGMFKRLELQKALGSYLSWKERYPIFFDDIAARLLPVIPLIVYRLIENDATDLADRILLLYSAFLHYYPFNFTFVRDILAYFYGHLSGKLIVRVLKVLDLKKIPFSESFPQHINSSSNAPSCPPLDYFVTLLLGIVNNVIPPLNYNSSSKSTTDITTNIRTSQNKNSSESGGSSQKGFYQMQDPGTKTQLILETAVIEILTLPVSTSQIVSSLVQIIVHIQPMLIQSSNSNGLLHVGNNGSVLPHPTSPSGGGGSSDSMGAGAATRSTATTPPSRSSGYTCQQLSCLLIQACGLLLAQLPTEFHVQLYLEASRVIKESWWLNTEGGGKKRSLSELDSAVGYALLDPSSAAQDNTSTAIGNTVALLHAFFSNLPYEWLEGTHLIINHLRPVTSVAVLRIAFRIMGPLLPRLANAHDMFCKTLSLLLNILVDVFGKNSQVSTPIEASDIADLVDFLHHAIHYEGQGGPVQANSKPRLDVLGLCGRALENLRPDIQHLLCHLTTDVNSSIYAAAHQS